MMHFATLQLFQRIKLNPSTYEVVTKKGLEEGKYFFSTREENKTIYAYPTNDQAVHVVIRPNVTSQSIIIEKLFPRRFHDCVEYLQNTKREKWSLKFDSENKEKFIRRHKPVQSAAA